MNTIILGTSIKTTHDVEIVSKFLNSHGGIMRWSIDLLDWERVLKIVALNTIKYEEVENLLNRAGYNTYELAD